MTDIVLFSTIGCHLCEDAEQLLQELRAQAIIDSWLTVDIADSDDLVDRYGIRIPVVSYREQELGWPFTIEQLKSFLA